MADYIDECKNTREIRGLIMSYRPIIEVIMGKNENFDTDYHKSVTVIISYCDRKKKQIEKQEKSTQSN